MTDNKRFTIKGKWSKSLNRLHGLFLDNDEDMYVTDVVYLLNKFLEENEELKEERDYFERKKCEYFNKYNQEHLNNIQLKEENGQLKQIIESICKDYEESHGMDIRNAEWFTAW